MSKHQRPTPAKHQQPIRNLSAFMAAYLKSESFQRALNRPAKMIERKGKNSKREVITWKEYSGGNQLAHALADAFKS